MTKEEEEEILSRRFAEADLFLSEVGVDPDEYDDALREAGTTAEEVLRRAREAVDFTSVNDGDVINTSVVSDIGRDVHPLVWWTAQLVAMVVIRDAIQEQRPDLVGVVARADGMLRFLPDSEKAAYRRNAHARSLEGVLDSFVEMHRVNADELTPWEQVELAQLVRETEAYLKRIAPRALERAKQRMGGA